MRERGSPVEAQPYQNPFMNRTVLTRLGKGPSTDAALAATLCIDLHLVQAVLRGLEAVGRVTQDGVLWRLVEPRRAA